MTGTAMGQGFRRSIGIVLAVLFLDLTTGYESIPWQWPVVSWQMYHRKAREEPLVKWRRLVAHSSDGSSAPTGNCGTLQLLEYPYRMDSILRQSVVGLLSSCLRELQSIRPLVTAVSLENRTWRYQQQTLEAHLAQSAAQVYRVVALPVPLPLEASRTMPDNSIRNGDFESIDPATGLAQHWTNPSARQAIGVDIRAGNHTGLVPPLRAKKPQLLVQELSLPPTSAATTMVLSVLALAEAEGASIELNVPRRGNARAPLPGDGAWHRVEVAFDCGARATKTTGEVRFTNAGSADAFVDDVSLSEAPSTLGMAH